MAARAALLLIAPLLWAPGARAQTVARQRAVVDSLRAVVARAEAQAAARESAARAARRVDTVSIGGITIVSDSAGAPRLRAAAESTWAVLSRELGATPGALGPRRLFVRFAPGDLAWADLLRPGDQYLDADRSDVGLRHRLVTSAGAAAAERLGARAARWAGAGLGLQFDRARLSRRALVEMVTDTSPPGRACNAGDLAACATALGIEGPATLSAQSAGGALRTAGRLGGAGAFDRLVADTAAPLAHRLAAMAGAPLDSVLTVWWREARSTGQSHTDVPASTRWITLAWALGFAGLALRSTRWR